MAAGAYLSFHGALLHSDVQKAPVKAGVTIDELKEHVTPESCWVVIHGQVYDVTEILPIHPGGRRIIMKYAGKDATKKFDPLHAPDMIKKFLPEDKHLGPLIGELPYEEEPISEEEEERLLRVENIPPIGQMFNLSDFESVAKQTLTPGAWAYYSSGADDEISLRENHNSYLRIFFRPRVLVDVKDVSTATTMLGVPTAAPFYITATALAKLGHPDGELSIARGAGNENIIQMISTLASCSFDDITGAALPGQSQWFQLYLNPDRSISRKMVEACEKAPSIKGIFLTVDAPQLGKREKDMRLKFDDDADAIVKKGDGDKIDRSQGATRALSSFIDMQVTWKDIDALKKSTNLPIVIKGIQRYEDVILAVEHGVDAVVLSNHGGRQLDYALSPLEVLAETMPELRKRQLDDKIEVYIDGGVRRGTDVIKALCLGAKGVGLGRPFLYANSSYGEDGVIRAIQVLKEEMDVAMRLMGVNRIEELNESFLDMKAFHGRTPVRDSLYYDAYDPVMPAKFRDE
ncbi:hypothetical protein BABINDRAFT_39595 [Babjeviella inositovora NRRL Y-12698]|uniref:L-lactate dehydrogenase (cytochrome) n=1 Tax=Babjeviella inositovora NRRL Y-12698 TaxID=984486 RepID=A0A1E3QLI6_9ASCO|nr:uncharacterized protein BABINDRAFT_39595 [Babjeviella inositovora NRRL Y-12698]ODQ78551.1 hypothetical protein BABINDRAFT_39595 [Babjeviella inositovora NRRL Y-12698]